MADEYPRHLFKSPGPYGAGNRTYRLASAADADEEAALIEAGWRKSKAEAWGIHPLDHDGDGKKGGSTSAAEDAKDEVQRLRAEYQDRLGKKPFPGWDAETLRAKMEAHDADAG